MISVWNTILQSALLGTDKQLPEAEQLPDAIKTALGTLNQLEAEDKEERFLRTAALAYQYRQCGESRSPVECSFSEANPESKPYCSSDAMLLLARILEEESESLLRIWLQLCEKSDQLIFPSLLPELLDLSKADTNLQALISSCGGERAKWLSGLNPEWTPAKEPDGEETWLHGNLEERTRLLHRLRETDYEQSMKLLTSNWSTEDANSRQQLLGIIEKKPRGEDLNFLKELLADKSKKVREVALRCLQSIPGSEQVILFQEQFKKFVTIQRKRNFLLGAGKPELVWQQNPDWDKQIFVDGIDALSPDKQVSDDDYIFMQLLERIPPSFLETYFDINASDLFLIFQKDEKSSLMLFSLANAAARFREQHWLHLLSEQIDFFNAAFLAALNEADSDAYAQRIFEQSPDSIVNNFAPLRQSAWSVSLSRKILPALARYPRHLARKYLRQHLHLIPTAVVAELAHIHPEQHYYDNHWEQTVAELKKLDDLRTQTLNVFTPK